MENSYDIKFTNDIIKKQKKKRRYKKELNRLEKNENKRDGTITID